MSLSHPKPSFFSLALPHPPITLSPCVPLQQLPTVSPNRHFTPSRPRHSTDSWNSVEDETTHDWTPDQVAMLALSLDSVPSHLASPFSGSIPPSNLLDKIGRHILDTKTREEWPHSLRSTRVKLLHIAKQDAQVGQHPQQYPTHQSPLASSPFTLNVPCTHLKTPGRAASRRAPLYRQNSMDFLPIPEEKSAVGSHREHTPGSSLQRSKRVIAHAPFHPYERSHPFASHNTTGPSPLSRRTSSDGRAASRTRQGYTTLLDSTTTQRSRTKMKILSDPEAGPFDLSSTSLSSSSSSTRVAMATALGASNSREPIISMPLGLPKKIPTLGPRSRRTRAVSAKRSWGDVTLHGPQGDANSSDNPCSLRRSSRGSLDACQSPKRTRLISSTSIRSHPYSHAAGPSGLVVRNSPRLRRVGTGKYFSPDDENSIPTANVIPGPDFHRMVGRKISFGSDHGRGPVGIASVAYILDAPFEDVTGVQK